MNGQHLKRPFNLHHAVDVTIMAGGPFETVICRLPVIFKMFPMIYTISVPSFMPLS